MNRTELLPDRPGVPPMAKLPEAEQIDPDALLGAYRAGDIDLVCVLGPTASGKTRYAVRLAGAVGGHILSADSRQVFRGMDIGTGKDLAEYGDVPFHLIDIVDPGTPYNIFEYQRDFAAAYAEVRSQGAVPILCGGSGLYIEAATRGYRFEGTPDPARLVPPEALPRKTFYIGTRVSREERVARIDRRLDERLAEGLVDEVRGLLSGGVSAETLIRYGLEYKFVTQYILGEITYEEMHILLGNAIHQFAKRQMTWFRGMERDGVRIHWV